MSSRRTRAECGEARTAAIPSIRDGIISERNPSVKTIIDYPDHFGEVGSIFDHSTESARSGHSTWARARLRVLRRCRRSPRR
jgi:hypothetical protein